MNGFFVNRMCNPEVIGLGIRANIDKARRTSNAKLVTSSVPGGIQVCFLFLDHAHLRIIVVLGIPHDDTSISTCRQ